MYCRRYINIVLFLCVVGVATLAVAAAERDTLFTFAGTKAKTVFLVGEFNHWSTTATPMKRDSDGKWTASVPLPIGRHAYKFFVDGDWKVDEANPERSQDGFGGMNSMITVADTAVDPVVNEKDAGRHEARRALSAGDFAQVEKTAALLVRPRRASPMACGS